MLHCMPHSTLQKQNNYYFLRFITEFFFQITIISPNSVILCYLRLITKTNLICFVFAVKWRLNSFQWLLILMLTQTGKSISFVAQVTGTGEATRGVGTDSIRVTVISISGTLINIYNNYYSKSISSSSQE